MYFFCVFNRKLCSSSRQASGVTSAMFFAGRRREGASILLWDAAYFLVIHAGFLICVKNANDF